MSSELWERLAALNKRVLLFNRCIRGRGEGTEPTTEHSKGTNGFRYSWSQILPVLRLSKMPTSLLCRGSDVRQVLRPWAVLRDGERPVKGLLSFLQAMAPGTNFGGVEPYNIFGLFCFLLLW